MASFIERELIVCRNPHTPFATTSKHTATSKNPVEPETIDPFGPTKNKMG